ncbi:ABC transporter ATP-binding protein [Microbulbifer sp. TRSA007]|uniref:ABC transporter ATP-binding protein n=1 Tax=Microbulbifer sp. TRSA007 TaxID=3243384 RepID=UPI0040399799
MKSPSKNAFISAGKFYLRKPLSLCSIIISTLIGSICLLLIPISLSHIGEFPIQEGQSNNVFHVGKISFVFIAILAAGIWFISSSSRFYLISRLTEEYVSEIREKLYRTWLQKNNYDIKDGPHEVTSSLFNDTHQLQSSLSQALSLLATNFFQFIGSLTLMAFISSKLLFAVFLSLLCIGLIFVLTEKKLSALSNNVQEAYSSMTALALEVLKEVETVCQFKQQELEVTKFNHKQELARNSMEKRRKFHLLMSGSIVIALCISLAIIVKTSIILVEKEEIIVSELIAFLGYTFVMVFSFSSLIDSATSLSIANGPLKRIEKLTCETEIKEEPDCFQKLTSKPVSIIFDDVYFQYPEKEDLTEATVCGLNFSIYQHQTVAIVGRSGSGKSTLLKLLTGKYKPTRGSVKVNGQDISKISKEDISQNICLLSFNPIIFSRTVKENILYGRINTKDNYLKAISKIAQVDNFIEELENGYGSQLYNQGYNLSTGQRQRIAIARALTLNSPILLFDEATAALDSKTEREVIEGIIEKVQPRVMVIVSHRLSTLKSANKILVLDKGCLIESGTHYELTSRKGAYYSIFQDQIEYDINNIEATKVI